MSGEVEINRGEFIVALTLLVALATALVGWWAPAAAGLLAGVLLAGRRKLFVPAAFAGVLGWGLLLIVAPFGMGEGARLASAAGAVMGMNAAWFITLTLSFAGLLTGSAAVVGRLVRRR